jgi:hypothetical protein
MRVRDDHLIQIKLSNDSLLVLTQEKFGLRYYGGRWH